jgi:hypothetical protein
VLPAIYTKEIPWYLFLLEAVWTPGLLNEDRRNSLVEYSEGFYWESNPTSCLVMYNPNQLWALLILSLLDGYPKVAWRAKETVEILNQDIW